MLKRQADPHTQWSLPLTVFLPSLESPGGARRFKCVSLNHFRFFTTSWSTLTYVNSFPCPKYMDELFLRLTSQAYQVSLWCLMGSCLFSAVSSHASSRLSHKSHKMNPLAMHRAWGNLIRSVLWQSSAKPPTLTRSWQRKETAGTAGTAGTWGPIASLGEAGFDRDGPTSQPPQGSRSNSMSRPSNGRLSDGSGIENPPSVGTSWDIIRCFRWYVGASMTNDMCCGTTSKCSCDHQFCGYQLHTNQWLSWKANPGWNKRMFVVSHAMISNANDLNSMIFW